MKEGPTRTDYTVTDARISAKEKIPRKCGCGWEKTTTLRGLHIHMGKKKCGGGSLMQPCTAPVWAGQTNGIQGRVDNHSANGPNVAEAEQEERKEEEERDADEPQEVNSVAPLRMESNQRARNLKNPLRRNKIKWPKANEAEEWRKLDEHLSGLLQKALRGSVVAKLNMFGEILYEECSNRYGEVTIREALIRSKGRREKEIDDLVASRRQLRKRWRKAEESEKKGLKALWDEIRRRLTNLRRAERIRRWRKRNSGKIKFLQESIPVCTRAP